MFPDRRSLAMLLPEYRQKHATQRRVGIHTGCSRIFGRVPFF